MKGLIQWVSACAFGVAMVQLFVTLLGDRPYFEREVISLLAWTLLLISLLAWHVGENR